jgi:hypothetical protein
MGVEGVLDSRSTLRAVGWDLPGDLLCIKAAGGIEKQYGFVYNETCRQIDDG